MLDTINFIDEDDYKTVKKDSRISCNQIKTRESSFKSISNKWKKFRISLLNKKLEKAKNDLAEAQAKEDIAGVNYSSLEKEIIEKNAVVSRLEEKIRVLSKESVPKKYASSRPIKLSKRKGMFDNLVGNGMNAYMASSGMAAAAGDTSNNDVDLQNGFISRDDIKAAIEESFAKIDEKETNPVEISPEDVEKEVKGVRSSMFDDPKEDDIPVSDMFNEPKEDVPTQSINNVKPGYVPASDMFDDPKEDVPTQNINGGKPEYVPASDMFDDPKEDVSTPNINGEKPGYVPASDMFDDPKDNTNSNGINRAEIEDAVNKKLQEIASNNITKNESYSAKVDRYDENGLPKRRRGTYTPMTDEEILRSRENIEYDKYEKIYADAWAEKRRQDSIATSIATPNVSINNPTSNVNDVVFPEVKVEHDSDREDIIVVPTRDDDNVEVKDGNLHFDYSDATEKDVTRAIKVETTAEGFEAIKARVFALKEQNAKSKATLDEVRRAQEEESRRALDIKNAAEKKAQNFRDAISKFNDYCEALEHDTDINMHLVEDAKTDIESNRRIIEEKQAEIEDYDNKIDEINSYISPEAVNVTVRR